MPYDPGKDKILKKWKCNDTGLVLSINQYGEGGAKLAGRLSMEDFLWLYDMMDEIRDELTRLNKPE
ncbi:MAG: hypothetical protein MUC33_16390 [Desulfobacterales bacterium]|nr:hypothetical protein [Desulfobacterales bacterium]